MTTLADLDVDIGDSDAVAERRDQVLVAVRDHAGRVAYNLARVQGGDYGERSFTTETGEWTVKFEAGDIEYLRYKPQGGGETYVVSTKQPAEPEPLARALADYGAFVEAYNDYVASLDGMLADVDDTFPSIETTEDVVAERDRIVNRIEECCNVMAGELQRYEGTDYGNFSARVGSNRWELKWDLDGASYLRAGGSNGIYLVSQYGPPSATDIREYTSQFTDFVDAYNDHIAELELDLQQISL